MSVTPRPDSRPSPLALDGTILSSPSSIGSEDDLQRQRRRSTSSAVVSESAVRKLKHENAQLRDRVFGLESLIDKVLGFEFASEASLGEIREELVAKKQRADSASKSPTPGPSHAPTAANGRAPTRKSLPGKTPPARKPGLVRPSTPVISASASPGTTRGGSRAKTPVLDKAPPRSSTPTRGGRLKPKPTKTSDKGPGHTSPVKRTQPRMSGRSSAGAAPGASGRSSVTRGPLRKASAGDSSQAGGSASGPPSRPSTTRAGATRPTSRPGSVMKRRSLQLNAGPAGEKKNAIPRRLSRSSARPASPAPIMPVKEPEADLQEEQPGEDEDSEGLEPIEPTSITPLPQDIVSLLKDPDWNRTRVDWKLLGRKFVRLGKFAQENGISAEFREQLVDMTWKLLQRPEAVLTTLVSEVLFRMLMYRREKGDLEGNCELCIELYPFLLLSASRSWKFGGRGSYLRFILFRHLVRLCALYTREVNSEMLVPERFAAFREQVLSIKPASPIGGALQTLSVCQMFEVGLQSDDIQWFLDDFVEEGGRHWNWMASKLAEQADPEVERRMAGIRSLFDACLYLAELRRDKGKEYRPLYDSYHKAEDAISLGRFMMLQYDDLMILYPCEDFMPLANHPLETEKELEDVGQDWFARKPEDKGIPEDVLTLCNELHSSRWFYWPEEASFT